MTPDATFLSHRISGVVILVRSGGCVMRKRSYAGTVWHRVTIPTDCL
jgi:hypothetical protein